MRWCAAACLSGLLVAGCGDAGNGDDGGDTQAGSGDVTGTAGSSPGSTSSDPTATSSMSTDAGDATGPGDTTDAADASGTGPAAGNCVDAPQPDCPPAPGTISTALADALLAAGSALAVDVRGDAPFAAAHLPGATVLDAADLRATVDGVSGQVAPADQAQLVFEAAGIAPDDALIVYGANNATEPARVVWTLAYYGHTGSVWMLDGGLDQWTAEGRGVEMGGGAAGGSAYAPVVVDALRVDEPWVLDHLDDPGVTLVDARSDGEFAAGHIPGALSVDWARNLGADGLLLPDDELRALYGDPAPGQTLVAYCQTGSRASVDWLVLARLGYADVRLYDGSWSEWSADPSNPVEP